MEVLNSSAVRCGTWSRVGDAEYSTNAVILSVGQVSARNTEVLTVVSRPIVSAVSPASGPTQGSTQVAVTGTGLGFSGAQDVQSVSIGGRSCTQIQLISPTWVSCRTPSGAGRGNDVQLTSSTGVTSTGGVGLFDYNAPTIGSVSPKHVLTSPDDSTTYDITIIGENLAAPAAGKVPSQVVAAGLSCSNVTVLNETAVRCNSVPASDWPSSVVSVEIEQQVVTSRDTDIFRAFRSPSVAAVVPAEAVSRGRLNVTVIGAEFGSGQADIAAIYVGSTACLAHYFVSDSIVTCVLPPGTGQDHEVVVENSLGLRSSDGALFSYSSPVIHSIEPGRSLEGDAFTDLMIRGENLGAVAATAGPARSLRDLRGPWIDIERCNNETVVRE